MAADKCEPVAEMAAMLEGFHIDVNSLVTREAALSVEVQKLHGDVIKLKRLLAIAIDMQDQGLLDE